MHTEKIANEIIEVNRLKRTAFPACRNAGAQADKWSKLITVYKLITCAYYFPPAHSGASFERV